MTITIIVHGTPRTQGSMSLFKARNGHTVAKYSSSTYEWRNIVTEAALAQYNGPPLDEPVHAVMVFEFARPKGHYGTGRNASTLKPSAPTRPHTSGNDIEKLVRAVHDSLTDAGVLRDDCIVTTIDASKFYAEPPAVPGVTIVLTPEAELKQIRREALTRVAAHAHHSQTTKETTNHDPSSS